MDLPDSARVPPFPFASWSLEVTHRQLPADTELMFWGRPVSSVFFIEDGWAIAHRSLRSGVRQVTSVFVAGDPVGLPPTRRSNSCRAEASVMAASNLRVAEVSLASLQRALAREPALSEQMQHHEARASAMLRERLVSLGRRSAQGRTAHFFLELSIRLCTTGAEPANRFACPLSQYVVSDALGLSAEHLNRVLRQLRLAQLLRVRGGMVDILDRVSLERLADFDPDYLSAD